ncbi:EthD family reductase [Streptomyces gilvosporeus]|uniref:Ethyl tert-butyl ether degradation protein EthD n=1 Tax=Streptomyces gilvosporeus TaxID=553510 RepID=A0A1V0TKG6_9ACTN|nr:EthD family reductase [Streptomyces gilvosporeus]ARF53421.1 ethyl tert-butyl ether degradation protein EthD [Streptomyces gilvosporeus]
MPTKITAIYENPKSPEAFEADHHEQIALAKKIPGVKRIESAKVWPKEDGSATPAYRVLDMYFTDYDAASRAVTTEEAAAFVAKAFELATGGVRLLFADVEEA